MYIGLKGGKKPALEMMIFRVTYCPVLFLFFSVFWGCISLNTDFVCFVFLTLSRSLILCHSKSKDDSLEESQVGPVSDGCSTWGMGWKPTQTHHRDTENTNLRKSQQPTLDRNGGTDTNNLLSPTLSTNKRSIRRSFSIKVWQQHFALEWLLACQADNLTF